MKIINRLINRTKFKKEKHPKTIDKIREYIKSEFPENYQIVLDNVYINPKFRNEECQRPNNDCKNCELNFLLTKRRNN
jgi:hypothetical protein